jgi:hypothetical protein
VLTSRRLRPPLFFEGGQSQLELVDAVTENLELGFLGESSFCGPAQSRRSFPDLAHDHGISGELLR